MHDALIALLTRERPVDQEMWRSFWDQLHNGGLQRGETVALLSSLTTRMPDRETLSGFLRTLDERRPTVAARLENTANIVGTGGGPRTFNISTASAFVAAAMGIRIVKTGSRAYSSTCGSLDLLEQLGIGLTASYEQTHAELERFGIAFPGHFVYPREVMLLAKSVLPLELRRLGGFLNAVGPFLAAMPVASQLVGVSDPLLLPGLRHLAATVPERKIWLCANDLGIDELVSCVDNVIHTHDGTGGIRLRAGVLVPESGAMAELAPASGNESVVGHFLDVVSGKGAGMATRTVLLNAAALAVASGLSTEWTEAIGAADDAMRGGAALDLVHRMRTQPARKAVGRGE